MEQLKIRKQASEKQFRYFRIDPIVGIVHKDGYNEPFGLVPFLNYPVDRRPLHPAN